MNNKTTNGVFEPNKLYSISLGELGFIYSKVLELLPTGSSISEKPVYVKPVKVEPAPSKPFYCNNLGKFEEQVSKTSIDATINISVPPIASMTPSTVSGRGVDCEGYITAAIPISDNLRSALFNRSIWDTTPRVFTDDRLYFFPKLCFKKNIILEISSEYNEIKLFSDVLIKNISIPINSFIEHFKLEK